MANYRRTPQKSTPPETCLLVDQLCIWGHDPETCTVSYAGYPLLLSPAEACLLWALATAESTEIEADAATRMCVKRINDKSRSLGGREIIVRDPRGGYRLNPYM